MVRLFTRAVYLVLKTRSMHLFLSITANYQAIDVTGCLPSHGKLLNVYRTACCTEAAPSDVDILRPTIFILCVGTLTTDGEGR